MAHFGKKKNYTDWLYTRPVLFFLGVLILLVAVAVFKRLEVEREMAARKAAAEADRNAAVERLEELEQKVEHLEDERGIEEEIRKHFDVAKEGETVVILTGTPELPATSSTQSNQSKKRWYQFWR